jgi:cytochrome P450
MSGGLARIEAIGEDPARLAELRRAGWAVRSDRGIEVLRYRQGVAALDHPVLEKGTSFQRRLDEIGITEGTEARSWWNDMLVTTEGDRRRALRTPFVRLLRGPLMRKLQEAIGEIVEATLDEIGDLDDVDLMSELAWKIPSQTYCHLVAAPMEHAPLAARLSDSTLAPILTSDPSRREESIEAFEQPTILSGPI